MEKLEAALKRSSSQLRHTSGKKLKRNGYTFRGTCPSEDNTRNGQACSLKKEAVISSGEESKIQKFGDKTSNKLQCRGCSNKLDAWSNKSRSSHLSRQRCGRWVRKIHLRDQRRQRERQIKKLRSGNNAMQQTIKDAQMFLQDSYAQLQRHAPQVVDTDNRCKTSKSK